MPTAPSRRTALLAWSLLLAGSAGAADVGDELGRLEVAAEARLREARAIEQRLSAATGSLDRTLGVERFQDAVTNFLLGRYEPAAETFFVLVASGVLEGTGLEAEAELYLGEALFALGFHGMAADTFEAVLARRDHPFRPDAVRRLLEIYALDPEPTRFERLFQREIVQRGVAPSDLVLYSVGKTLRARGDVARAKAYLLEIQPRSPYWARSRYLIGAMLVDQGGTPALREAIGIFREVSLMDPKTEEDRRVRDLSVLALGRLHDHLGEHREAVQAYHKLPEGSPYEADRLHELTWLYIEQGASGPALETVQKFLDAFPDHPFAADLRLVEGHLQFRRGDHDGAVATYEQVAAAYAPVRDRFARLAAGEGEAAPALDDVLAQVDDPVDATAARGSAAGAGPLPGFARAVMRQDPAFGRAVALWAEVGRTAEALAEAEAIVAELQSALDASGDDLLETSRLAALEGRVRGLSDRAALLGLQQRWLEGAGGHAELGALDERRRAVVGALDRWTGRLDAARTAPGDVAALERDARDELAALHDEVHALADAYRALRPALGIDVQMDPTSVRIDALDGALQQAVVRHEHTGNDLARLDAAELRRVQDVFAREARAVREQRDDLGREQRDTEAVASAVVRANFRRLADLFAERVLKAETGAVNVYWTRWVQAGEERKALADERSRAAAELEREFEELERKLGGRAR